MNPNLDVRIRALRRADRAEVRRICAATAWLGTAAPERIGDEGIWAEFWTRYFTDREPAHSWVVERAGGGLAGYLTGTTDARRFDRYVPFLLPGIVLRAIRRRLLWRAASRRAVLALLRSLAGGEMSLPPGAAADHPATFHVDLLGEARGRGLGGALLGAFLDRMRVLGVRGVHAQSLSVNEPMRRLLRRTGFTRVGARRCSAFRHVDPRTIDVQTWVLALGGGRPAAGATRAPR